jgi:peroxiredoxin
MTSMLATVVPPMLMSRILTRTLLALAVAAGAAGCKKASNEAGGGNATASGTATASGSAAASGSAGATTPPTEPPPAPPSSPVVGKPAPDFTLEGLDGQKVTLSSFKGKVVVLEWFNPGCPFVKRSHTRGSLVGLAEKHAAAGVVWLAINSGAPGKQGHEVAENQAMVDEWKLPHPVLRDISGEVGHAYGATNTPNMFVIDTGGTVVYGGAIDNSPDAEGGAPIGGTLVNHVDAALADLAAGRPVATPVTRPYGCSVKYDS